MEGVELAGVGHRFAVGGGGRERSRVQYGRAAMVHDGHACEEFVRK
jgi:hypothetical protein